MPNMTLPPEERDLTPEQVAALDMRRRKGTLLLIISGMFGIIAVLLTLWAGQDWQYSPGIAHPMIYYFLIASSIVVIAGGAGVYLRRGTPEIQ